MKERPRRRLWPVQVLQHSANDCGPAALLSVLAGFGVSADFQSLREACQTAVDGTSIDALQSVAAQLGLRAVQHVASADVLLDRGFAALPAIAVTRLPDLRLHFVVLWRRIGSYVVVMDPSVGNRLVPVRELEAQLYRHRMTVPTRLWRVLALRPHVLQLLVERLRLCGVRAAAVRVKRAVDGGEFAELAGLDAMARWLHTMRRAGARTSDLRSIAERLTSTGRFDLLPEASWAASSPHENGVVVSDAIELRGAVALSFSPPGRHRQSSGIGPLSAPQLARISGSSPSPMRALGQLMRADGLYRPLVLLMGVAAASLGIGMEALLLRSAVEVAQHLGLLEQRLFALSALGLLLGSMLALEYPLTRLMHDIGARLDARLRIALWTSLRRLPAQYVASRAAVDIASRAHAIVRLRSLPVMATRVLRAACELLVTSAGVLWLAPNCAPGLLLAVSAALAVPLLAQFALRERDARLREHDAALNSAHFEALRGLAAVRAHAAERAVRREHEALAAPWAAAARSLAEVSRLVDVAQAGIGAGFTLWLLCASLSSATAIASSLLLMYWALGIPRLSQEFALAIRQYPALRNIAQRVLEPLAAADHGAVANLVESSKQSSTGAAIHIDKVSVSRSRSVLLDDVDCEIAPGDHIAIVGASGAGKTSLVALLLGLLAPDSGRVSMDVEPQAVAWVDPAIQLWNRSLLDNVAYGAAGDEQIPLHTLLEAADLVEVLQGLPNGLQSSLGEGGGFLSGGEGQRVRLARALAKHSARLVLLDEPFRGLDREQRAQLLRRARAGWSRATLLCITHNIAETRDFPRVLVLREGRIVEDGNPAQLAANSGSHYAGLLAAHGALGERWLSDSSWRHGTLQAGQLVESEPRREA